MSERGRVGIVLVSHSRPLAEATADLAREMAQQNPPRIEVAAGATDGGFGTDAVAVAAAIGVADSGDGVVVLTDLGSAVLSAQTALEFLDDPGEAGRVRLVAAPFVEGTLAAVVRAGAGGSLDQVADEARAALAPKTEQLGEETPGAPIPAPPGAPVPEPADAPGPAPDPGVIGRATIRNDNGLHARPAATLATEAGRYDARIQVATDTAGPVEATSPLGLASLGVRAGDVVEFRATGPQARDAVEALVTLTRAGLGEPTPPSSAASRTEAPPAPEPPAAESPSAPISGVVVRLDRPAIDVPSADPVPGPARQVQVDAVTAARDRVAAGLRAHAERHASSDAARPGDIADILEAGAAMAEDPALLRRAVKRIRTDGLSAEAAIHEAIEAMIVRFGKLGGRMAEREADLVDVRRRYLAVLAGQDADAGLPHPTGPYVAVAHTLAPADAAELDPETCRALVTATGSATAHAAIIVRALGIPGMLGVPSSDLLVDGQTVRVDPAAGEITSS